MLQYAQDSLAVEVLLNPSLFTLTQCFRNVLRSPTGAVHIIYAGAAFEETGSWILGDGSFSAYNFYELVESEDTAGGQIHHGANAASFTSAYSAFSSSDSCRGHQSIAEHLSSHDIVVHFYTEHVGEWIILSSIFANHHFEAINTSMTSSLILQNLNQKNRRNFSINKTRRHLFHFDLNPPDSLDGIEGSSVLLDFLAEKLTKHYQTKNTVTMARFGTSADSGLSDSVGHIRLNRPTMYVFPGGQGDCSLFGLDNGFTMLIDGGFLPGHKSYWNLIRHLQRLDSIVVCYKCFCQNCQKLFLGYFFCFLNL